MNKDEARTIAMKRLEELRAVPYAELRRRLLDNQETSEVTAPSGTRYQLEMQAVMDGVDDDLRVIVSVDDGGWRSFVPLTDSFIIRSDGAFVGE